MTSPYGSEGGSPSKRSQSDRSSCTISSLGRRNSSNDDDGGSEAALSCRLLPSIVSSIPAVRAILTTSTAFIPMYSIGGSPLFLRPHPRRLLLRPTGGLKPSHRHNARRYWV